MIVLCNGEGATDIGRKTETPADLKSSYGAMGALILQMMSGCRKAEEYETDGYKIVPDSYIDRYKDMQPEDLGYLSKAKHFAFRGAKHKEIYFQKEARCFGFYAKEFETHDDVVAILFHDADPSHANDESAAKRRSIYTGFETAGFQNGIAMMPNPTSEAWILQMFDDSAYRRLVRNTTDSKKLKSAVADEMNRRGIDTSQMYAKIRSGEFSSENLRNDESFQHFKQRFCEVLFALHNDNCFDCDENEA